MSMIVSFLIEDSPASSGEGGDRAYLSSFSLATLSLLQIRQLFRRD